MPTSRWRNTSARAVGALVALVALVATLLTVLPTQARAELNLNRSIDVSDLSLVASNANGVEDPDDTTVQAGDLLKLKFTWDARNANAKSGDSFQIRLPDDLVLREWLSVPIKITHQNAEYTIGECVTADRDITCTFNTTLDTLVDQGFTSLRGNGTALVHVYEVSNVPNLRIDANGKQIAVPVPGGRVSEYGGREYKPQSITMSAYDLTDRGAGVTWEVTFGALRV